MRAKPAFGGIAILVAGIMLAVYGAQTVVRDVPATRTDPIANLTVEIQDNSYWSFDSRITRPSYVAGKASVMSSQTGLPSDINFFVLDSTNFEKWKQRQPGVDYISKFIEVADRFSFNLTTLKNDTYHFVFDNYYSTVKKTVGLQVTSTYDVIEKKAVVDYTFSYVGIAVAAVGIVVAVYGIAMPPEIVWSRRSAFS